MHKRSIILYLLLFAGNLLFGQETYEKGVVIFKSGDKIDGYLQEFIDWDQQSVLRFKRSLNQQEPQEWTASDIFAYQIGKERKCISATLVSSFKQGNGKDRKTVFLNTLIEGEVSLFEYLSGPVRRFFLLDKTGVLQELNQVEEISFDERLGSNYRRKEYKFRTVLAQTLKGCIGVMHMVHGVNLTKTSLMKILADYHDCKGLDYDMYAPQKVSLEWPTVGLKGGLGWAIREINGIGENNRQGYDLGLVVNWMLPVYKANLALQLEGMYSQGWGLASEGPIPFGTFAFPGKDFITRANYWHTSILLEKYLPKPKGAFFANAGVNFIVRPDTVSLAIPKIHRRLHQSFYNPVTEF